MKYILIGAFTLIITLLLSKILMAINLIGINQYQTPNITLNSDETDIEQLRKTGKSIYLVYCSSCHGKDGKGNRGKAQDHTKRIAKKSVLDIINNGSNNFTSIYPSGMPAGLVTKSEAKELAKYVAQGLKGDKPKSWASCASCHDETGKGIAYLAPSIKTYSNNFVTTVLSNGKKGVIGTMPSFAGRLTPIQMKAVATYIRSIGD
jgi:cytochrome c oxidase cbb3-type subunit III